MIWGGAQWVLATFLVLMTVVPPLARWALLTRGRIMKTPWIEFWGAWLGDTGLRVGLVVVLYWGGFWG